MVDHVGVIVFLLVLLAVPALGVIVSRGRAADSGSSDESPDSERSGPEVNVSWLAGVRDHEQRDSHTKEKQQTLC